MKKFLLFILGFFIGILLFLPKTNLYYFIQTQLQKEHIYINSKIKSDILSLSLINGKIYYETMKIAEFQKIKIHIFLIYNKLTVKNLKLEIGNYKILNASVVYTILNPFKAEINAETNFADVKGYINLKNRYIKLYFHKITDISIKKFLKKDKKGYYYYVKY
jgi:hypothetical protein